MRRVFVLVGDGAGDDAARLVGDVLEAMGRVESIGEKWNAEEV
jgi:hypothetical protein